eukprot:5685691-Pyramimonas_sp.AAC.1
MCWLLYAGCWSRSFRAGRMKSGMSVRSMSSSSSSAVVGNCMQNSLMTEWKASLRSRKEMLHDLDLPWQSQMKARLV